MADELTTENKTTTAGSSGGPGEALRKGRETAGLSQQQVAQELRLKPDVVGALERNDYDSLPESAYIKGYLRTYARLVGLDAERLIAAFDALGRPEPEWDIAHPPVMNAPPRKGVHLVTTAVIAALLILFSVWLLSRNDDEPTLAERPTTPGASGVAQTAEPGPGERPEETSVTLGGPGEESPLSSMESAPATTEIATLEGELPAEELAVPADEEKPLSPLANFEAEIAHASGDDEVELTFQEESWAEVYDANKQQLMYGLIPSGSRYALKGTAPFHVVLGNAPGVQVTINGKPYDHSWRVRRNKTVRFDLHRPDDDI